MDRALSGSGGRPAWAGRATFAAEAAAVAVLAYLLARLAVAAWPPLVDIPLGLAPASVQPAARSWSTLDPFRAGALDLASDASVEAPTTSLNLILVGARAGADGRGSAIIQTPDNQQRLYRVGDVILEGAVLTAVEPGRIVIGRADGSAESLKFEQRESLIGASGAAVVAEAAATAEPAASPARVGAGALASGLSPFESAEGVVVMPAGDGAAFAAAGFEPFDVVLSVNGVGLENPSSWQAAFAGIGPGSAVTVELERAGAPATIQFVLE